MRLKGLSIAVSGLVDVCSRWTSFKRYQIGWKIAALYKTYSLLSIHPQGFHGSSLYRNESTQCHDEIYSTLHKHRQKRILKQAILVLTKFINVTNSGIHDIVSLMLVYLAKILPSPWRNQRRRKRKIIKCTSRFLSTSFADA